MATRPPTGRDPQLRGLHVLVVGLGKSGLAATRLAAARGARVTVSEAKPEASLVAAAEAARRAGAEVRTGGNPPELVQSADLVVLSPGVPPDIELLREARRRGIPIWGEVELAARFCQGRVIGITGSNGKSTVTAMTGTILRGAGIAGGTGGNLGTPFSELLSGDGPTAVHAVELSSFQCETLESLHADVAVVTNLSPDHLDRYADLEAYARAKTRLLELQRAEAAAVLNADDPPSARFFDASRGEILPFSVRRTLARGGFLERERLVLSLDRGLETLLAVDELPVRGEHNVANALAAALACRWVGCSADAIAAGLRAYRALPHRLEPVGTVRGVAFYNDSKATNPDAALRALAAFAPGTVHLILGGRDKGLDWSDLMQAVGRSARRVLLVGESAQHLETLLPPSVERRQCGSVNRAVTVGLEAARPGEVVLLAPGCASYDQYRNFEERGEDFRRAVAALADAEEPHA